MRDSVKAAAPESGYGTFMTPGEVAPPLPDGRDPGRRERGRAVNALPVPSRRMTELKAEASADLAAWASRLTEHGLRLFAGTLAGYPDPVVRRAVLAALAGAEAGQGLTGEPPARVVWRAEGAGPWAELGRKPEGEASVMAKKQRFADAQYGITARTVVLPPGEHPDGTAGGAS